MFGRLKGTEWGRIHEESEVLAMQAEELQFSDPAMSRTLYHEAAIKEEEALQLVPQDKQRTYEIVVYSTAVLYYKSADFINARRICKEHRNKLVDEHCLHRLEEVVLALDNQN